MICANKPAVVLAPMEGVTDAPMRALMGELGGFTLAVSEFLRVSQVVPGPRVFMRHVPELLTGSRTPTGLPVVVQLLGGDAGRMAEAAAVAASLGAAAIDINFGCPAKTVNRHDGGATLLKYPGRIREIVRAVRAAVPGHIPVSAKLRLGWDDITSIDENAAMAAEGGASWLTIHGRTRAAGYAPPVFWEPIGRVRERLGIPVIANGDIRTVADFRRCREVTGCLHFMIGRGALADPRLAWSIAHELGLCPSGTPALGECDWVVWLRRLVDWAAVYKTSSCPRTVHRLKQWLSYANRFGRFDGFERVKRAETIEDFFAALAASSRRLTAVSGTVGEHPGEDGNPAEQSVPRPATEDGRSAAEVAPQCRAVW